MQLEELLARLEGVRRTARGWMARCPAHDDRNPSLSIGEGNDGRILLHCHALCDKREIMGAVGLTSRDLFRDHAHDARLWREVQRKRQVERERQDDREHVLGLSIDCRREADYLLASARNPGLIGWTDDALHDALNVVADALVIFIAEKVEHGDYPF